MSASISPAARTAAMCFSEPSCPSAHAVGPDMLRTPVIAPSAVALARNAVSMAPAFVIGVPVRATRADNAMVASETARPSGSSERKSTRRVPLEDVNPAAATGLLP